MSQPNALPEPAETPATPSHVSTAVDHSKRTQPGAQTEHAAAKENPPAPIQTERTGLSPSRQDLMNAIEAQTEKIVRGVMEAIPKPTISTPPQTNDDAKTPPAAAPAKPAKAASAPKEPAKPRSLADWWFN